MQLPIGNHGVLPGEIWPASTPRDGSNLCAGDLSGLPKRKTNALGMRSILLSLDKRSSTIPTVHVDAFPGSDCDIGRDRSSLPAQTPHLSPFHDCDLGWRDLRTFRATSAVERRVVLQCFNPADFAQSPAIRPRQAILVNRCSATCCQRARKQQAEGRQGFM